MSPTARAWHGATGAVAAFAVVFQLVLVVLGHGVLDESDPPSLATRVERFFCYFTILSNVLVAAVTLHQAARPDGEGRGWRVLRINALVGIVVTAVVHWFLLRPLLDLAGADRAADTLLHVVVPAMAVLGWLAFGPRGRVHRRDILPSTAFPVAYLLWTLVHGAWREWYPYPFVDVGELGYAAVLLNALAVVVLMALLTWGLLVADRALTGGPVADDVAA